MLTQPVKMFSFIAIHRYAEQDVAASILGGTVNAGVRLLIVDTVPKGAERTDLFDIDNNAFNIIYIIGHPNSYRQPVLISIIGIFTP